MNGHFSARGLCPIIRPVDAKLTINIMDLSGSIIFILATDQVFYAT